MNDETQNPFRGMEALRVTLIPQSGTFQVIGGSGLHIADYVLLPLTDKVVSETGKQVAVVCFPPPEDTDVSDRAALDRIYDDGAVMAIIEWSKDEDPIEFNERVVNDVIMPELVKAFENIEGVTVEGAFMINADDIDPSAN